MAKTAPVEGGLEALLSSAPERRIEEGRRLAALFAEVTGFSAQLWSNGVLGYGAYRYRYKTGHEGYYYACGFALRAKDISIHILPGYAEETALLARLGPHKAGQSCLYITRLARVDTTVLAELIANGLERLQRTWTLLPK